VFFDTLAGRSFMPSEKYLVTGYKALIVDKGVTGQVFSKTLEGIESEVATVLAHSKTSKGATATIFEQREVLIKTCQKPSA
jgi:hypothetical protein